MAGSADLVKAIVAAWDDANLEQEFTSSWDSGDKDKYEAFNDTEASPGQPFPYAVYEQSPEDIVARMSGEDDTKEKHRVSNHPWQLRIYTKENENSTSTAKELAVALADLIMQTYGGHPTAIPKSLTLDNGAALHTQLVEDYGVRSGDEEYTWIISYVTITDVPEMGN